MSRPDAAAATACLVVPPFPCGGIRLDLTESFGFSPNRTAEIAHSVFGLLGRITCAADCPAAEEGRATAVVAISGGL
jgi:hypothetical protein